MFLRSVMSNVLFYFTSLSLGLFTYGFGRAASGEVPLADSPREPPDGVKILFEFQKRHVNLMGEALYFTMSSFLRLLLKKVTAKSSITSSARIPIAPSPNL